MANSQSKAQFFLLPAQTMRKYIICLSSDGATMAAERIYVILILGHCLRWQIIAATADVFVAIFISFLSVWNYLFHILFCVCSQRTHAE